MSHGLSYLVDLTSDFDEASAEREAKVMRLLLAATAELHESDAHGLDVPGAGESA